MAVSSKPAAAVDPAVVLGHRFPEVAALLPPPFRARSLSKFHGLTLPSSSLFRADLLLLRREVRSRSPACSTERLARTTSAPRLTPSVCLFDCCRDVALYALGVGACGADAVDDKELRFVYHRDGQPHIKVHPPPPPPRLTPSCFGVNWLLLCSCLAAGPAQRHGHECDRLGSSP
jgi:hypothetical protein